MYDEDDIGYVDGRLRGTVVRYKDDTPVNVMGVERDGSKYYIIASKLKDNDIFKDRLREFKLESPPLGYANFDGRAWYIGRKPMRHDWRQGVRPSNLVVISPLDRISRWRFDGLKPIYYAMTHQYPDYKEAVERVEDIYVSCAFSPYFSVNQDHEILYKNQMVVGNDTNGIPRLLDQFNWLRDLFHEHAPNTEEGAAAYA